MKGTGGEILRLAPNDIASKRGCRDALLQPEYVSDPGW